MMRLLAFVLRYRRAVGIGVALVACGGVALAGAHRYRNALMERGRVEMRAVQLDSLLRIAQQQTGRVDTVRVEAVKRFTRTVTQWKTDTVRLQILALPDTSLVPVAQYRALSSTLDSVATTAAAALSAADSVSAAERREKLLWRATAESQTPPIIHLPPDRWKYRKQGMAAGVTLAAVAFLVTR